VDNAAIPGEQAAMRVGDDIACGCDPVLQRHLRTPRFGNPRHFGMVREHQTRNLEILRCAIAHRSSMLRIAPE
jgi:hypothetical protein